MIILGLGHKAQNGKDTAGEAIKAYYDDQAALLHKHGQKGGLRVFIAKFAAALYKECREQHGMIGKDTTLLQNVGSQRRDEDPYYWVNRAFDSIPVGTDLVIFTDVRYQNEAARIRAEGGHLINVVRLNENGARYIANDRSPWHLSETDLDVYNWDYEIVSKTAALTGELAITIAEFIRGLESK
jgi:hypothetical protein